MRVRSHDGIHHRSAYAAEAVSRWDGAGTHLGCRVDWSVRRRGSEPVAAASDRFNARADRRGIQVDGGRSEPSASLVGVPVFHGVGDLASTTVGAVGIGASSGASYMYLGTSGWIARCVPWTDILSIDGTEDRYVGDGVFRLLHPDPSLAIVAASMVTAGG